MRGKGMAYLDIFFKSYIISKLKMALFLPKIFNGFNAFDGYIQKH